MKTFLRDMFIGWIIYTDSGKKVANKIVNYAYNQIKANILSSSEITEQKPKKDNRNYYDKQSNDRSKN